MIHCALQKTLPFWLLPGQRFEVGIIDWFHSMLARIRFSP
jgi:hypothetical protein